MWVTLPKFPRAQKVPGHHAGGFQGARAPFLLHTKVMTSQPRLLPRTTAGLGERRQPPHWPGPLGAARDAISTHRRPSRGRAPAAAGWEGSGRKSSMTSADCPCVAARIRARDPEGTREVGLVRRWPWHVGASRPSLADSYESAVIASQRVLWVSRGPHLPPGPDPGASPSGEAKPY